jgi:hypothetical protein
LRQWLPSLSIQRVTIIVSLTYRYIRRAEPLKSCDPLTAHLRVTEAPIDQLLATGIVIKERGTIRSAALRTARQRPRTRQMNSPGGELIVLFGERVLIMAGIATDGSHVAPAGRVVQRRGTKQ